MTKQEAQREAQRLLSEARGLICQAEALMDEHRFSLSFLRKQYCPQHLTEEELESGQFPYAGAGGVWLSSSDRC